MEISEPDWKKWKKLRLRCIDDFCHETFTMVREIDNREEPIHDKHRALYRLVDERNDEIMEWFDPKTRSRAIVQLLNLYRSDRVRDEDVAQFSGELSAFLQDRKNL
jgi:hypothetical protein